MTSAAEDRIIAATIATEVPPPATSALSNAEVERAIQAVCDVIRNRVRSVLFPSEALLVVLEPKQFSGVGQDYWWRAVEGKWYPAHVLDCLAIWRSATTMSLPALYYYSPISMRPPFSAPSWAFTKVEIDVPTINQDYFRFFE